MSSSSTLVSGTASFGASSQTLPSQPVDSDAKSDASFDPLFDDEPEGSEPLSAGLAVPSKFSQFVGHPDPTKAPPPSTAPAPRAIAPPKNAPPLLDPATSGAFSPDILMTASIDGQVILWDKRAYTPGTGVGRLWMSEKTPPWCLSVRSSHLQNVYLIDDIHRLAGPQMAAKSTLGDETVPSTFGIPVSWGASGPQASRAS